MKEIVFFASRNSIPFSGNTIDMNKMFENEESHETEQIMSPEVLITFNSRMRDIVYDMVRLDYINEKSLE